MMRDHALKWLDERIERDKRDKKETHILKEKYMLEDEIAILLWIRHIVGGQPYDA